MKLKTLAVTLITAGVLAGCSHQSVVNNMKSDKIIIAHRGAVIYLSIHWNLKHLLLHNKQII